MEQKIAAQFLVFVRSVGYKYKHNFKIKMVLTFALVKPQTKIPAFN
jgi:hypothetical protein